MQLLGLNFCFQPPAPSPPTTASSLLMFRNSSPTSSSQRRDCNSNFGVIAYSMYRTERKKGHRLFHLPMKRTTSIMIIVRNTLFQNNATLLQSFMRKILCHLQKHTDMKIIFLRHPSDNATQSSARSPQNSLLAICHRNAHPASNFTLLN